MVYLMFIILIVLIVIFGFSRLQEGLGNLFAPREKSNNSGDVSSVSSSDGITVSSKGSYFFFRTDSQMKYINFLESLDKEKYEILDITIQPTTYCRDDCFMITYRERINEAK